MHMQVSLLLLRRRPLKFYTLFVDFSHHVVLPGDLVSCLVSVAVEKLPDDALSQQVLLTANFTLNSSKSGEVGWRKNPSIVLPAA